MSAAFTQGILIKALCAFPLEEVQPLKGVEHLPLIYSELCCQGVNACVCCPVADGKARPATALTAQAGDKTALLSVSCSPQGNRDVECVHALSVFPHPQLLIYYHTHRHTHSHSTRDIAVHFISCCLISVSVWGSGSCCALRFNITMLILSLISSVDLYIPCLTLKKKHRSCHNFGFLLLTVWDMTSDSAWQPTPLDDTLNASEMFVCLDVTIQTLPGVCLCDGVE